MLDKKTPTPLIVYIKEPTNNIIIIFLVVLCILIVVCGWTHLYMCKMRREKTRNDKRRSLDSSTENDTFINQETVPVVTHGM